jgi:hypothetical protein
MAISTTNAYTYTPASFISNFDRSGVTTLGAKTIYKIDYRHKKGYPNERIKWCRRNMGERGIGWDFMWVSELLTIEIWDDKLKFMYEMWKN